MVYKVTKPLKERGHNEAFRNEEKVVIPVDNWTVAGSPKSV